MKGFFLTPGFLRIACKVARVCLSTCSGQMSTLVTTKNTGTLRAKATPMCSLHIPTMPAQRHIWNECCPPPCLFALLASQSLVMKTDTLGVGACTVLQDDGYLHRGAVVCKMCSVFSSTSKAYKPLLHYTHPQHANTRRKLTMASCTGSNQNITNLHWLQQSGRRSLACALSSHKPWS